MAKARGSRMSRIGTRKQSSIRRARVNNLKPLKEPSAYVSHRSPAKSGYFVLLATAALHGRRGRRL